MLIQCNECGNNISSKANSCPHCGCPDIETWKTIKIVGSPASIEESAFEHFKLEEIEIPNTVANIGSGAFWECSNLESITIPSSVTNIGIGAFYHCTSLHDIKIPESVVTIEKATFTYCINLRNISLPNSLREVGCEAFKECISLTEIKIPEFVEDICGDAFRGCCNLENVTAPEKFRKFFEDDFPNVNFKSYTRENLDGYDDLNPYGLEGNDYESWMDSID